MLGPNNNDPSPVGTVTVLGTFDLSTNVSVIDRGSHDVSKLYFRANPAKTPEASLYIPLAMGKFAVDVMYSVGFNVRPDDTDVVVSSPYVLSYSWDKIDLVEVG